MAADTSAFADLESEYLRQMQVLQARVSKCLSGETSEAEVASIHKDVAEPEHLLNQMDYEARSSDKSVRQKFKDKTALYRSSLHALKKDVNRIREGSSRRALLGIAGDVEMTESVGHRERLLAVSNRQGANTAALESARRTVAETEDVAIGITQELARNRETIMSARGKARQTISMTGQARRMIAGMRRRDCRQKCYLFCAIAVLLAVIILILYFAVFNTSSSSTDTAGSGSGST